MGRKKSYDAEALLTCVTHVFWQKGFESTTIAELEAATGVNRKSLFHAFDSKEALFERALKHYLTIKAAPDGAVLAREPLGPHNICAFFEHIHYNEDEWGCLLALTIVEKQSVPPAAYEMARQAYLGLEQAFLANLLPLVRERRLASKREAVALASYLKNALLGIIVNGRAGATNGELRRVVKLVLSVVPDSAR